MEESMNKTDMIAMLERHIQDQDYTIDNLLEEIECVKSAKVRASLEEQIGHYSRMAQNNREMIKELKK
jgi:DNA polymerase II small subunit/DNA polymerase delta subunit B